MRRTHGVIRFGVALGMVASAMLLLAQIPCHAADIPARPEGLQYRDLKFEVPKAEQYRHRLKSGIVAYVVEDHALPLVTVSITVRVGSFLEPAEKTGLASLTGTMMRKGGAGNRTAEEFDERADFLAADISSSVGEMQGNASVNCLSAVLSPSLDLLFDLLRTPRFQQDRVDVEKSSLLEDLKQRNDDAGDILNREWAWLLYGESHFSSREMTQQVLDSLTRDDMVEFHRKYWRPQNMILSVAGDVNTQRVLADLEKRFAGS